MRIFGCADQRNWFIKENGHYEKIYCLFNFYSDCIWREGHREHPRG